MIKKQENLTNLLKIPRISLLRRNFADQMKVASCFLVFVLSSFFSAANTNNYAVFEENGKVGLKTTDGQVLIPAQYDALGWSDGKLSVINTITGFKINGLWGLINLSNHKITKPLYDELIPGEASYLLARKKSSLSLRLVQGCINTEGKEVIPFQYDGIKLNSLRAIVYTKIGNIYKYGLIDLQNKALIPQQFKYINSIGSLRYAVENFDNKSALFGEDGKQITPFHIDSISVFRKNYAIIYQNLQQGVIDREGQIKVEAVYREINIGDDGTITARQADEWLLMEGSNKLLQKTYADAVQPSGTDQLRLQMSGEVFLTNTLFKPVNNNRYHVLGAFENGKAIVTVHGKQGLIRQDGLEIIPAKYLELIPDRNFILARQKENGRDRWVVLDSIGKQRSLKSYDLIRPFNGEYFAVKQRDHWGAINFSGKEVLACSYDSLIQAKDNFIVVKFRGQHGIMSLNDEWKVTPRNNQLRLIGKDRFIEITSKTKFIKTIDGGIIYFTDNLIQLTDDYLLEYLPSGTIWKVDMDGRIVDRKVQPDEPIEKIYEESEGLRGIKKNGKFGFIDSQGRLRIANRYEGIQKFSEGLAAAMIRGHWGYINREDKIAIQPAYEEVADFKDGFALVKQKGFYGLINKQGVQVLPTRYESIEITKAGNLLIRQDKLYGLADAKGRTLIQPRYPHLEDVGNGFAIVARDGKYGVVTHQAISTIPLTYDLITFDPFNKMFIAMKKSSWTSVKL
jgi:hypothetical protein